MKYRYSYDYMFIPSDEIQVGDKSTIDLSISVEFTVYYKGEKLLFDKEDSYFQAEEVNKSYLDLDFVIDEDNMLYLGRIFTNANNETR